MGGVGFFRSTQPHKKLEEMYPDEFSVTIDMNPNWGDLDALKKYQLVHVHKGLFRNIGEFRNALKFMRANGIVTVMDIDDHWRLHPHHPQYASMKAYNIDKEIIANIKLFDYVTTTTPLFAEEIKRHNKNVVVIPNAIDPTDERFQITKNPSDKLRFGLIMGSSHEYDVKLIEGLVAKLPKEILDKIQIVLCGFDIRGTVRHIDSNTREVKERPMKPIETVWYRYEKQITENYKIVSPEYQKFLMMFVPDSKFPNEETETYRRCWTKDMNHYYEHYKNVDVLLVPLEVTDFNKVKSQLKVIESCFSKTAIVASDFGPYQIDLKNAIEKGGTINKEGNAILIDEAKNHKDWAKTVKRLVENPDLVKMLQDNLYNDIHEKYDLKTITAQRAEFYKESVEKAKSDNV